MTMKQTIVTGLSAAGLMLAGGLAFAAGQYGPGVSDTEIKIGNKSECRRRHHGCSPGRCRRSAR
jgi:hypothetical protein